jgi:polyisoprenoid-binding protein YceI
LLGALLAASAPLVAQTQEIAGRCAVRFFGTSTLHDFEGSAPCALLAIDAPDANGRYAARAEVAVAQMETGISARDRKMREMFEAKKFPRIVASFGAIDAAALRAKGANALPFQLTVHGVTRSVTPVVSGFSEVPGKSARFTATFELSLAAFGMEAPVAMGFVRVGDGVRVAVDVELAPKNGGAAGAQSR